jgi:hypothetical protein
MTAYAGCAGHFAGPGYCNHEARGTYPGFRGKGGAVASGDMQQGVIVQGLSCLIAVYGYDRFHLIDLLKRRLPMPRFQQMCAKKMGKAIGLKSQECSNPRSYD